MNVCRNFVLIVARMYAFAAYRLNVPVKTKRRYWMAASYIYVAGTREHNATERNKNAKETARESSGRFSKKSDARHGTIVARPDMYFRNETLTLTFYQSSVYVLSRARWVLVARINPKWSIQTRYLPVNKRKRFIFAVVGKLGYFERKKRITNSFFF